jgi:hypothetical protein
MLKHDFMGELIVVHGEKLVPAQAFQHHWFDFGNNS